MERRQFLKSATAAASLPLLPAGLSTGLPVSAAQYAKAIEAANLWAYMTVGNLKRTLGVDEATSRAVLSQLQMDGVLGPIGKSGITLTQKFVKERVLVAAKSTTATLRSKSDHGARLIEKAKDILVEPDEPDLAAENNPADPSEIT